MTSTIVFTETSRHMHVEQICLHDDLRAELDRRSAELDRSRSWILRRAFQEFVQRHQEGQQ